MFFDFTALNRIYTHLSNEPKTYCMHSANEETPNRSGQSTPKRLEGNSPASCVLEANGAALILFPFLSNLAARTNY
jgi:hypothetical protein